MADDVAISLDRMSLWTEEQARAYFESGGTVAPDEQAEQASAACMRFKEEGNAKLKAGELEAATSLYMAAQEGHAESMRLLLAANAAINRAKINGATPLYVAAQHGHVEPIRLLLAKGAAVDQTMNDGASPLLIAACNGHLEPVRLLLRAEADLLPYMGVIPLEIARRQGHTEVAELLQARRSGATRARCRTRRRRWRCLVQRRTDRACSR